MGLGLIMAHLLFSIKTIKAIVMLRRLLLVFGEQLNPEQELKHRGLLGLQLNKGDLLWL